jgi:hypothetical protein
MRIRQESLLEQDTCNLSQGPESRKCSPSESLPMFISHCHSCQTRIVYLVQNQLQQTYLYIIQLATGPFANLSNHLQYPIGLPSPSNNQMKFQMALPSPATAAPHFMAPHAPTCLGLPKPSAIAPWATAIGTKNVPQLNGYPKLDNSLCTHSAT